MPLPPVVTNNAINVMLNPRRAYDDASEQRRGALGDNVTIVRDRLVTALAVTSSCYQCRNRHIVITCYSP